jgi:hypothetical protein
MKRIELKQEWLNKEFQLDIPGIGYIMINTNTIGPEGYEYWINKGYSYLFNIIEEPEPQPRVISYQGVEPTSATTTTQTVEPKPKKKRGRKPKAK